MESSNYGRACWSLYSVLISAFYLSETEVIQPGIQDPKAVGPEYEFINAIHVSVTASV